jgi:lipopolysaccharide export LptBFGC system permease protein LptF
MPFIIIFGFILCFIKFDKDKEIIAMFSLGVSIYQIKKPLIIFTSILISIYILLNLFLSPYIYEKYKNKEFDLRNKIDLNKINLTNFLKIDDNIVLDFEKKENLYHNIFINFNEKNENSENSENSENIIFAKKGYIENTNEKFIFNLVNGFKLNITNDETENLKFERYKLEFLINHSKKYEIFDKNSLTIFDLLFKKDYEYGRSLSTTEAENLYKLFNILIISKIFDILNILLIIFLFYMYIIKKNNYNLREIFQFILISLFINIIHNIIKNTETSFELLIFLNTINIMTVMLFVLYRKFQDNE